MLKGSGVGIVRMDISWGGVEKTEGKYDFRRHDKLIEDLDKLGIRLLFVILNLWDVVYIKRNIA